MSVYPIRGTQVTVNSPQILEGVAERLLDQLTDLDPKLGGSKNAGALWGAQGSGMHPISNTQLVATPPPKPLWMGESQEGRSKNAGELWGCRSPSGRVEACTGGGKTDKQPQGAEEIKKKPEARRRLQLAAI